MDFPGHTAVGLSGCRPPIAATNCRITADAAKGEDVDRKTWLAKMKMNTNNKIYDIWGFLRHPETRKYLLSIF